MSEEKLYMVKNDEGEYWDFDCAGFWRREIPGCYATISKMGAGIIVDEQGGHIVTLVEETEKVVLTKEQAEIVEEAHGSNHPANYISDWTYCEEEELLMRAYVNGYTVEKEPKYYVKVLGGDRGYLNIYSFNNDEAMIGDRKQNESFQVLFTATEIEHMKQREDIPLDWDKVKLIEVDEKETIDGESDF